MSPEYSCEGSLQPHTFKHHQKQSKHERGVMAVPLVLRFDYQFPAEPANKEQEHIRISHHAPTLNETS